MVSRYIKISILFAAFFCAQLIGAQNLSISIIPSNTDFTPVSVDGKWNIIQSGTLYETSYSLPETVVDGPNTINLTDSTSYQLTTTKSYTFLGYRVGDEGKYYSDSEIQAYLRSTTVKEVSVSALCREHTEVSRTDYKNDVISGGPTIIESSEKDISASHPVSFIFYNTPIFKTTMPENGSSVLWSATNQSATYSYEVEGGSEWKADFYYTIDGGVRNYETDGSLVVPLVCEIGESSVSVSLKNVSCTAPDGRTDWTPANAKVDRIFTYTIWSVPEAVRESTVESTTYVFNGKSLILNPQLSGGDNSAWTYSWSTATGDVSTVSPSLEISTNNGYLASATNTSATTMIVFTAKNQPAGIEAKDAKTVSVQYDVTTVSQPTISFKEQDYVDFTDSTFVIEFTITDSNTPYYPSHNPKPNFYCVQNGKQIPFVHLSGDDYSGTSTYSAVITPSISAGAETVLVYWNRELLHDADCYHPECQFIEFTKEIDLKICRLPNESDIDLSGNDKYALARLGYQIDLMAQGQQLPLDGTWSYNWEMNGDSSSNNVYVVSELDLESVVDNNTYTKRYYVDATYRLNNQKNSQASVKVPFSIIYCAEPHGIQTQSEFVTCVGLPTNLGLTYTGGYRDGWSTKWFDDLGNELSNFSGNGGSVTINVDIDSESVTKKYHAVLINQYKEKEWANIPLDFDLTIYKRPTVSINQLSFGEKVGTVNLYGGDSDQILVSPDGGYPNNWEYEWLYNEKLNGNTDSKQIVETIELGSGADHITEVYKVRVRNNYNGTVWCDTLYTVNYQVWSKGQLNVNTKVTKEYLYGSATPCDGKTWNGTTLAIEPQGGYPEGWKFQWEVISDPWNVITQFPDKVLTSRAMNTVLAKNTTGEIQPVTIRLTASNSIGNNLGNTITEDYSINVYPEAYTNPNFVSGIKVNRYYGDVDNLSVDCLGGNGSAWKVQWETTHNDYNDCSLIDNSGLLYRSATYNASATESDAEVVRSVTVRDYSPDEKEKWYEQIYTYPIHLWSRGDIQRDNNYKTTLYGGNKFNETQLLAYVTGGYFGENSSSQGNQFTWKAIRGEEFVEKTVSSEGTLSTCEVSVTNRTGKVQQIEMQLDWQNMIDENHLGNSNSLTFKIDVYPGADRIPEAEKGWTNSVVDNPEKRRDIDEKNFVVTEGLGGYTWKYVWTEDGNVIDSGSSLSKSINLKDNRNEKNVTYKEIVLYWYNQSPDGIIWEEGTLTHYLKVYNTPICPSSIRVKGNGTSNIYIADMSSAGLTDEQLFSSTYDYRLQFGDGSNYSVEGEESTQRWHQYSSAPSSPWVRSCWHYEDFDCYSDMIDIYGNTRSAASIVRVEEDIEHNRYIVLSLNGTIMSVADSDDISELDLTPGFYIIKNAKSGDSRKIMVK